MQRKLRNVTFLFFSAIFAPTIRASDGEGTLACTGDVTDVRVVRAVQQHPLAWRVWQPFIIQGEKKRHLVVAFGAMVNGKKDMGDILVS